MDASLEVVTAVAALAMVVPDGYLPTYLMLEVPEIDSGAVTVFGNLDADGPVPSAGAVLGNQQPSFSIDDLDAADDCGVISVSRVVPIKLN